jgi:hypothetical protein
LGVISSTYKTLQLPTPAATLAGVQELAISVEDKGGAAEGRGPRLPYLFKAGWSKRPFELGKWLNEGCCWGRVCYINNSF